MCGHAGAWLCAAGGEAPDLRNHCCLAKPRCTTAIVGALWKSISCADPKGFGEALGCRCSRFSPATGPAALPHVFESRAEAGRGRWGRVVKIFGVPKSETCCASSPKRIWGEQKALSGKEEAESGFALMSSPAKSLPQRDGGGRLALLRWAPWWLMNTFLRSQLPCSCSAP